MDAFLSGLFDIFKFLFTANPVAAILLAVCAYIGWRLWASEKHNTLLRAELSCASDKRVGELNAKEATCQSEREALRREISELHAAQNLLTERTVRVLEGVETALTNGNPLPLLREIKSGTLAIGRKHELEPYQMGMQAS